MGRHVVALLAPLLLAACASTGLSDSEKLALYRANAGEPVQSFRFLGRLNGWTALGDSAVAVLTSPREAWLLELSGRCPDLPYAQAISVTSNMNRVHSRFDRVQPIVGGGGGAGIACHIREIRPLDAAAVRAAERELRDGGEVVDEPREGQPPASGT